MKSAHHLFEDEIIAASAAYSQMRPSAQKKRVKLAIQGGGVYGAYSSGILIQMLLDPTIEIVEIAGTSAGEKIAMVVADRINRARSYDEGRIDAINALFDFWGRIVRDSAITMSALDVIEKPMDPQAWTAFMRSMSGMPHFASQFSQMFNILGGAAPFNPFWKTSMTAMQRAFESYERSALERIGGNESANLPILNDLVHQRRRISEVFAGAAKAAPLFSAMPQAMDMAVGSLHSASAAVATNALRDIISNVCTTESDARDPEDRIFTHAASGKFIKVYINTAMEQEDGSLVNTIHTAKNLTVKRSMGSSALMGLFDAPIIKGRKHWDGGYTENTCLMTLANTPTKADAIMIIGTNRPKSPFITPRLQRDIPSHQLQDTGGLIWWHMYDEAVLHAENAKAGTPTWHMLTYNHSLDCDWTAKQNTRSWHVRSLLRHGQDEWGLHGDLITSQFGKKSTIERAALEEMAASNYNALGVQTPSRVRHYPTHVPQAA
ncbi:MAG: hypothetical protein KGQ41_05150 [Alphaproteobacteria bacterium]|nr:hypothetical protein [Alphaproteobacteria bacterium]